MNSRIVNKSSFFGLNENIAAGIVAGITVILTFVPYVSYFAWIVPLIWVIFERGSYFVRLCAGESAVLSALITVFTLLFELIEKMVTDESSIPFMLSLCGIVTSIVRVVCMIALVLTAYNGYFMRDINLPVITPMLKKIIKDEAR